METKLSWLDVNKSAILFGEGSGHVPVRLVRLKEARILWVNYQVSTQDPNFERCGQDRDRYEAHLLEACAYGIAAPDDIAGANSAEVLIGYADRYGGYGIGANGGSGRAVVLKEYSVKGCGRTPLVSATTDANHASGGAYLEEIVRETIYSEIVRAEFPFSAIPTLAIIDTGLVQIWDAEGGKAERRVLMVRPNFIRPAHYIRSQFFLSNNHLEGAEDHYRVTQFFKNSFKEFGKSDIFACFVEFWFKWAEQLAYSFIHRLPHGSNTLSNVSLDGSLLDFGAISAVASWANIATMMTFQPFGSHPELLKNLIASFFYFLARHLDPIFSDQERLKKYCSAVQNKYYEAIVRELFIVCGVSRVKAAQVAATRSYADIFASIISSVIGYYQAEKTDFMEGEAPLQKKWDLHEVWSDSPPRHLEELKSFLYEIVHVGERDVAQKRCLQLSRTRSGFCRPDLKARIFEDVDFSWQGKAPDRKIIEHCISMSIAEGRRDSRCSVAEAYVIGFAVSTDCSYVIFRSIKDASMFAMKEFSNTDHLFIKNISFGEIEFHAGEVNNFIGTVVLF